MLRNDLMSGLMPNEIKKKLLTQIEALGISDNPPLFMTLVFNMKMFES